MKKEIDINVWKRKELFQFFGSFEEPFFGVTVHVDVTHAYALSRKNGCSFFLGYLYRALKAANQIEEFRYRIVDGKICLFDHVDASSTISRPDGTFGFAYMNYTENAADFYNEATVAIDKVRREKELIPAVSGENVIHFSAVPWLRFTALSHARFFSAGDSAPKISFGKILEEQGKITMPVSVHAHHGLMDGYHAGLFIDCFQELLLY